MGNSQNEWQFQGSSYSYQFAPDHYLTILSSSSKLAGVFSNLSNEIFSVPIFELSISLIYHKASRFERGVKALSTERGYATSFRLALKRAPVTME